MIKIVINYWFILKINELLYIKVSMKSQFQFYKFIVDFYGLYIGGMHIRLVRWVQIWIYRALGWENAYWTCPKYF